MHSASPGLAFDGEDAKLKASPEVQSELLHALQEEEALLFALEEEQARLEQLQIMEALRAEEANLGELIAMMSLENSAQKPPITDPRSSVCR